MSGDPYVYPGTHTLVNKYAERNSRRLGVIEKTAAKHRISELQKKPVQGRFDYPHLQAIHKHIFQDVYSWAGKPRVIGISKPESALGGRSVSYPHPGNPYPENLDTRANYAFAQLARSGCLKGLGKSEFIEGFAKNYVEIWETHPFREGNTRATTVFMMQLAKEAGHPMKDPPAKPKILRNALVAASQGDSTVLLSIVGKSIHHPYKLKDASAIYAAKVTNDTKSQERIVARIKDRVAAKINPRDKDPER